MNLTALFVVDLSDVKKGIFPVDVILKLDSTRTAQRSVLSWRHSTRPGTRFFQKYLNGHRHWNAVVDALWIRNQVITVQQNVQIKLNA